MWALPGAISLQTPGHLRPAQQPGRVPPAGVLKAQVPGLFCTNDIESSSNRSLLDSVYASQTHLRRVPIYGCEVAWVLDPPPPCQERDASALLHLRFSCSKTHSIFRTPLPDLTLASAIFPVGPFLA